MRAASATRSEATAARPFGRFELRRVLGEGAQASVWLGFDLRLEREVAVKLMHSDASVDPVAVGEWLREARSVSRLTHSSIVPVFEADVFESRPYLVFEYVPGPTLAQLLKTRGALPAHEAVSLMLGVLDALHAAHGAGIVHRDLKPSNVLVPSAGRARVMDFGIAARLHDAGSVDEIVGTPGYMSPEATRGSLPTAAMDLFSVGVMLTELLSGRRLVEERDPARAMKQTAERDLVLPADLSSEVDDGLRRILRQALERAPERRWQSAAELRTALRSWLAPAPVEAEATSGGGHGTLEFLLRRMRHKTDFPALSNSVVRIQQVANSDRESVAALSGEILKDVALTNKLLRLVNSATYSHAVDGVSTVSRAVVLVGFNNVRNMALSLVLLEHMQDRTQAAQLREEFLRSLLAGMLASELASTVPGGEEAYLGALFQNLGRLLTEFYFPEEARQIRGIVAGTDASEQLPVGDAAASAQVLGIGFEALGLGVAQVWGLPASLQACMRAPQAEAPPKPPTEATERVRWLAYAANQVADTLLRVEPAQAAAEVGAVARRYARAIGVSVAEIEAASAVAQQKLAQLVETMGVPIASGSAAQRLVRRAQAATAASAAGAMPGAGAGSSAGDAATIRVMPGMAGRSGDATADLDLPLTLTGQAPAEDPCDVLTAGIQDVTNTLIENFKLNDVLRMILETMYRALSFRRVVFCLRDARLGALTGRFGFGEGVEQVAPLFKIALKNGADRAAPDLFATIVQKGADVFIADAAAASIASRLPSWYRLGVHAPSFLLLPVAVNGAPIALIYADREAGGSELGQRELSLLRTLRNQAVMAFKQSA